MNKGDLVLVTGGAGFVGSHLCECLANAEKNVISLDNYSTGTKENHVVGVEYREGHTKDIEQLVPEVPAIVYHLGEYARVEQSFEDVATVLDSNSGGTQAVLEFCRKKGCKIVYAGSSTKFGDGGLGRDQSPYAWTKASNTELVKNYGEWFSVPYAISYFYNVFGPRERGNGSHATVIGIFRERFLNGDPLGIVAPGTQRRNFTHVLDIIDGLVMIGEKGEGDGYGLGNPQSYTILEVAEMFGREVEMLEARKGNRMDAELDISKVTEEFGWSPKRDLESYIAEIVKIQS